jgi:hypothetical protein
MVPCPRAVGAGVPAVRTCPPSLVLSGSTCVPRGYVLKKWLMMRAWRWAALPPSAMLSALPRPHRPKPPPQAAPPLPLPLPPFPGLPCTSPLPSGLASPSSLAPFPCEQRPQVSPPFRDPCHQIAHQSLPCDSHLPALIHATQSPPNNSPFSPVIRSPPPPQAPASPLRPPSLAPAPLLPRRSRPHFLLCPRPSPCPPGPRPGPPPPPPPHPAPPPPPPPPPRPYGLQRKREA